MAWIVSRHTGWVNQFSLWVGGYGPSRMARRCVPRSSAMDGARLWQCAPFYQRTLAEIADLFDTVHVSFYKDLGAPAGAALTGTKVVIDEARVWQIRHGGRLFTAYPFLIAAERGLDEVLPRMPEFVARATELATALGALDAVQIVPDPPQTAMFPPPRASA